MVKVIAIPMFSSPYGAPISAMHEVVARLASHDGPSAIEQGIHLILIYLPF
jgi:hypothetical protein